MKDIEEMAVKAITDILARSDKSFEASMQSVALEAFLRGREQGRQERDRQWEIRLGEFRKDLERHNLHGHYNLFQEHFAEPMAERYVAGAAYRELMAAAQAHVTALEACEPAINNAFGFSAIHGGNYTGPTYGKELTALKAALAALPAQHVMYQDYQALEGRVVELEQQLAALTWTEITPENLPTGRPYLLYFERDGEETYATGYFNRLTKSWFIDQGRFVRVGYTHFFPINPPPPSGATGER